MSMEAYINWVKEVNLEASKTGKCLSCYSLNSNTLTRYYREGTSPLFAVIKLSLEKRDKPTCVCEAKGLK